MSCQICGENCLCASDAVRLPASGSRTVEPQVPEPNTGSQTPDTGVPETGSQSPEAGRRTPDAETWRQEVAARVNRYQARRKPRPPRYPSLQLRFEAEDSSRIANCLSSETPAYSQTVISGGHALALDEFAGGTADAASIANLGESSHLVATPHAPAMPQPVTAKIIEFPRSWTPPVAPLDELAEPVMDRARPRILEAPALVPPAPALGGIMIEPAPRPDTERRPGIDIPLQSAPLARRILSAAIDAMLVAVACTLFGFIFWKMTAIRPPRVQIIEFGIALAAVFWAAYQYLLLVYSGSTPGLRLARLQLARFDGSPASRQLRRWRVLASFLSAASLGMGYAWVFLDEDALCWHDRITPHVPRPHRPSRISRESYQLTA